jgi:hypothetical protein
MKTMFFAAAIAAIAVTAPVQAAEGFGILLGGSTWKIPSCKQGKVLREVRDERTGKLVWRCVVADQKTAEAVAGPRK